jgi:hypothetical protein
MIVMMIVVETVRVTAAIVVPAVIVLKPATGTIPVTCIELLAVMVRTDPVGALVGRL